MNISTHSPSFVLFPVNNNCTYWHKFGLPIILIKPNTGVNNDSIINVSIKIENADDVDCAVCGIEHSDLQCPKSTTHLVSISNLELSSYAIDTSGCDFIDNDHFEYTTNSGIRGTLEYLSDAEYYDLSNISINTIDLEDGKYVFSYMCSYYKRILSDNGGLICIDGDVVVTSAYKFIINHPGELIGEFVRLTPNPYLNNEQLDNNDTVKFYRPFVNILQDIYDESSLIEHVNWLDKIEPEFVPYLVYTIGLDIPFYPKSFDNLRKSILGNIVKLWNLKGSKKVLIDLFKIFGYNIRIHNLKYDGEKFIRPLATEGVQVEPLLCDYNDDGFGNISIPLLHRPSKIVDDTIVDDGTFVVDTFLVEKGSEIHDKLSELCESRSSMLPVITGNGLVGFSQVSVHDGTSTINAGVGDIPVFDNGVIFNQDNNYVKLIFSNGIQFTSDNLTLYSFITYKKCIEFYTSGSIDSNRFDVKILPNQTNEQVEPDVLNFLMNFLYKVKSFHSLLNVISYNAITSDVYNVTDFSVGGIVIDDTDVDLGNLQVPPAIMPEYGECKSEFGYKEKDLLFRRDILRLLIEEFEAWQAFDNRDNSHTSDTLRLQAHTSSDRDSCKFNWLGQDKIIEKGDDVSRYETIPNANANNSINNNFRLCPVDSADNELLDDNSNLSTDSDTRYFGNFCNNYTEYGDNVCDKNTILNHKFRGRVDDNLLYLNSIKLNESFKSQLCNIKTGYGVYFLLPANRNNVDDGLLGRLLCKYYSDDTQQLHYNNRRYPGNILHNESIALDRPNLGIEVKSMHFPGCRFISMNKLESDFISTTWKAKPWDDLYNGCNALDLNARLINHDSELIFDDKPYKVVGNGLIPDIISFGNHDIGSSVDFVETDVIHAIFTSASTGHPAISDEGLQSPLETDIDEDWGSIEDFDTISTDTPIFKSASMCTASHLDFCDGYPCSCGIKQYTCNIDRGGLYNSLFSAMGILLHPGVSCDMLFFLISGIYSAVDTFRLDCDGFDTSCDSNAVNWYDFTVTQWNHMSRQDWYAFVLNANLNYTLNIDANNDDFDIDSVDVINSFIGDETIGVNSYVLDGCIPSLFELI